MKVPTAALLLCVTAAPLAAQTRPPAPNAEHEALHAHFERTIDLRHARASEGIGTVAQWERRKGEIRAALTRMLWHDREWPAGTPPAAITHRHEYPAYTVENLVIETAPKLFLTANLYLPRNGRKPFPVVLYQCGHAAKTYYARHGAWFASHGIAALVMDNIEMGEIEFTHHGVYASAWFHWYSRGFSPLAVELWNARRAVDYLAARPDLDPTRIGATGRSGGGMTTFFLAALDDRIRASAPVSGTLSTTGWIQHRLTAAHCDCQYPVNSYGVLYSEVGALVAPRAQLLVNADADRGFPMDALTGMEAKMREIYRLYGAGQALGNAVAPGAHADTEAIRLPVYSFFLREFLGAAPVAAEGAIDLPEPAQLTCFRDGLPLDERLTRIDEDLIRLPTFSNKPLTPAARKSRTGELVKTLRAEVFRYFPARAAPLDPQWGEPVTAQGRTTRTVSFTTFDGLRAKAVYSLPANAATGVRLPAVLRVEHRKGIPVWGNLQPLDRNQWGARAFLLIETLDTGSRALEQNLRSFADNDLLHHMKREAMVAGTTLESMQVYEVLRALELLESLPAVDPARILLQGKGEAGINALYAALLHGKAQRVILESPPASHRQGPHYLGILRYTDIPEVASLLAGSVRILGEAPPELSDAARCATPPDCLR